MSGSDGSTTNSQPVKHSAIKVSRQMVIHDGMKLLHEIGADHICSVCIANGGSCCTGCRHLAEGVGCQLRNVSCTAWLCGFLKYILYETGQLQEWYDFWDQVPGQDYRVDFTPEYFHVQKILHIPNMRQLSEALASDLEELSRTHTAGGFIVTLREKINKKIDHLTYCKYNPRKEKEIKTMINILSSHFSSFHKALIEYRERQIDNLTPEGTSHNV